MTIPTLPADVRRIVWLAGAWLLSITGLVVACGSDESSSKGRGAPDGDASTDGASASGGGGSVGAGGAGDGDASADGRAP